MYPSSVVCLRVRPWIAELAFFCLEGPHFQCNTNAMNGSYLLDFFHYCSIRASIRPGGWNCSNLADHQPRRRRFSVRPFKRDDNLRHHRRGQRRSAVIQIGLNSRVAPPLSLPGLLKLRTKCEFHATSTTFFTRNEGGARTKTAPDVSPLYYVDAAAVDAAGNHGSVSSSSSSSAASDLILPRSLARPRSNKPARPLAPSLSRSGV